jgi:hypothetical protein
MIITPATIIVEATQRIIVVAVAATVTKRNSAKSIASMLQDRVKFRLQVLLVKQKQ